ncbi:MAG: L-2-amino-thiazoline-4-carboxylic acid hydrolase [Bacillota bacterium]
MDMPIEKKFKMQSAILRATHFEWRRAALSFCPDANPMDLVMKFWEEVGHDTADAYLKQIDPSKPLPKQLAQNTVFSSICMGEDAKVVDGKDEKESFVRHDGCPWYDWHKMLGLLEEDQPGCDHWFRTFVKDINAKLGTDVKWETQKCLAAGDEICLRRFWVD